MQMVHIYILYILAVKICTKSSYPVFTMCFMAGVFTRLTLKDVEKELKEVTDYYSLGLQLDVPQATMNYIEADYQSSCRRKSEVLKWWLANVKDASWPVVGGAVERMGEHGLLAESLKKKVEDPCLKGRLKLDGLFILLPNQSCRVFANSLGVEWSAVATAGGAQWPIIFVRKVWKQILTNFLAAKKLL